jgi:hypothetical protein
MDWQAAMKNGPRGPVFSYFLAERVSADLVTKDVERSPKFSALIGERLIQ